MKRYLFVALLSFGLLALIAGCSENSTSTGDEMEELADQFGGYLPTDEEPAFGDEQMAAEMEGDVEYDDPILLSPEVESMIEEDATGAYVMRIVWGALEYDSSVTELTTWDGSLSVSYGAVVVRHKIRFEPWQDVILPRESREEVSWMSKTSVHHDGLALNIYIPAPDSGEEIEEPITVTFDTEPFTATYTIDELTALDTVYYLEDSVNAVAVMAHKIYPGACPRGFLGGYWGVDSTGQGIFYGRWISNNGALVGHLRGHWGEDSDENEGRVFYGKYIDITGKFEGLLKGRYMPHPNWRANGNAFSHAGGRFYGQFYDENGSPDGVLKGHYRNPRRVNDNNMGFFQGRWKTYCPSNNADEANDGFDDNI